MIIFKIWGSTWEQIFLFQLRYNGAELIKLQHTFEFDYMI